MKYLYSLNMRPELAIVILNNIYDTSYSKYYWFISASRASALKYQKGNLEKEYNIINKISVDDIKDKVKISILNKFIIAVFRELVAVTLFKIIKKKED